MAGRYPGASMWRRANSAWPIAVLGLIAIVGVAGCGDDKEGTGRKVRANSTDLAFATQMLAHHELAIDAADLAATRARDRVVRRAARELIQLQAVEVQTLRIVRKVLADAEVEAGDLGVPPATLDPAALRGAPDFDRAYAQAMIAHHRLAIRMSAAERAGGRHAELRRMSEDITDLARFQERQLERRLDR